MGLDLQLGLRVYIGEMNGLKISEAASRTGFSDSALRFYEQQGVVVPERTASGYRAYSAEDIESLEFVARGKGLGMSLDEITELLALLDDDECRPVQERMAELLTARIEESQSKIADLVAFTGQLQKAAAWLGIRTPEGSCDDDCGCRSDARSLTVGYGGGCADACGCKSHGETSFVHLGSSADVACSLDSGLVGDRIEDWNHHLSSAIGRQPLPGGVRVVFPRSIDVGALGELASSEQACCRFFDFSLRITSDQVHLDVIGPADAQPVIASMFGVAA